MGFTSVNGVRVAGSTCGQYPRTFLSRSGIKSRIPRSPQLNATYTLLTFFRIKWKKDGREYLTEPGKSSTTEIRELDRVTSKLRIGDSAQSDAGRYSCEAENAYGKSHFSIDVTIWGE